jgi:hypothetical protein
MQVTLENTTVYVVIDNRINSDHPAEDTILSVHVNRASAVEMKNRLIQRNGSFYRVVERKLSY